MFWWYWTVVLAIVSLVWYFVLVYRGRQQGSEIKGKPIPGPKGLPLVGSAFDIQPETIHLKFTEYAKLYGNICQVKVFSDNMVILNDENLIRKAFQSEEYKPYFSDRTGGFYGQQFRAGNRSVVFVEDGVGAFQKVAKKAYIQALHVYGTGKHKLESTVKKELVNIVDKIDQLDGKPFDVAQLVQRSLANVISLALIGELQSKENAESDLFWQHVNMTEILLQAYNERVLTAFPFVKYLPGKLGNLFRHGKATMAKIAKTYFHDVKKTYVPGSPREIVDWYIDEQTKQRQTGSDIIFTDDEIIAQILETVDAGLTTSSSLLTSTMLILMNHPDVQVKLREEFDRVIGKDEEPSVEDRDNCIYFKAFEMEVHRYAPVLPITFTRISRKHIVFEGYDVQPKTALFGNIWNLHHNEEIWGDPWKFRPERFLDKDGQLLPREHKFMRNVLPFGAGQRLCPGEMFAKVRYFLYITTLLRRWTLTFPEGHTLSCDPREAKAMEASVIFRTKPFQCCAIPKSKKNKCNTVKRKISDYNM